MFLSPIHPSSSITIHATLRPCLAPGPWPFFLPGEPAQLVRHDASCVPTPHHDLNATVAVGCLQRRNSSLAMMSAEQSHQGQLSKYSRLQTDCLELGYERHLTQVPTTPSLEKMMVMDLLVVRGSCGFGTLFFHPSGNWGYGYSNKPRVDGSASEIGTRSRAIASPVIALSHYYYPPFYFLILLTSSRNKDAKS